MSDIARRLREEIVLFDGGMGTYIYAKGVFINACYDELDLGNRGLVLGIHREYLEAGAEVIETNTFGASRWKLAAHGLQGQAREINLRGAGIAREAAAGVSGREAAVAGAIGPLGVEIEPLGRVGTLEAEAAFAEQAAALIEGGVDLLVLETFSSLPELEIAVRALRSLDRTIPILAQVTIDAEGRLAGGAPLDAFAALAARGGIDAVGMNCSVGPRSMLEALERLRGLTDLPISVQPNAGFPVQVDGRYIYLSSPEYFAEYAKRFIQTGATILGGCCGTTPAHIGAMARAIRALRPSRVAAAGMGRPAPGGAPVAPPRSSVPLAGKSALARKLASGEVLRLVEIVSPRGLSAEAQVDKARRLRELGIDAINIPDGPRASARMSALALAAILQREAGIETLLHVACRDRNLIGLQGDLLGAWALGVRNILAITGDPPKLGSYPDATAVFDVDSIGLATLVSRLNRGLDLADGEIGEPTAFCLGVGVNPGAIDPGAELRRLEAKIAAGAEFMVTQPVFDIRAFGGFLRRVEGFRVPVVCGLWPLGSLRNAEFMNNEVPGASVPPEILERMRRTGSREEGIEEGISIARETWEAVRGSVAGIQLSAPLGRVEVLSRILGDGTQAR